MEKQTQQQADKKGSVILKGFFRCFMELKRRNPLLTGVMIALAVISALLVQPQLQLYRLMVDGVARHRSEAIEWWFWYSLLMVLSTIISITMEHVQQYMRENIFQRNSWNMFSHLITVLDSKAANQEGMGLRLDNLREDLGSATLWSMPAGFFGAIKALIASIAILASLVVLPWWLLIAAAVVSVPKFLVSVNLGHRHYMEMRHASPERNLQMRIGRLLVSVNHVETLHRYPKAAKMLERSFTAANNSFSKMLSRLLTKRGGLSIPAESLVVCLIAYSMYQAISHAASISEFVFYVTSLTTLTGSIGSFLTNYSDLVEACGLLLSIDRFMKTEPLIRKEPGLDRTISEASIRFENVSYYYSGKSLPALSNINLLIKQGERVLVVGRNGSGKTSLMKLLTRKDDPQAGSIEVGGSPLPAFEPAYLLKHIVMLRQMEEMLPVSMRDNITMGIPDQDHPVAFSTATRLASLVNIIAALPEGLDTIVGEKAIGGIELSGGEMQRVLLARLCYFSIVMDSKIIILDEPTTALDAVVTKEIIEGILSILKDRTVIVISHMLNLAGIVDRIVVLDHGSVVDTGSHTELMARCEIYKTMFEAQAKGYTIS